MNKYFVGYSKENYKNNIGEIVEYSKNALKENDLSRLQVNNQLESYLDDPISRIKLYDAMGLLIADVANKNSNMPMMKSNMMNNMMDRMRGVVSEEVDSYDIIENGITIGKLNITKNSSIENSIGTFRYNVALISNSIFSIFIVFIAAILISIFMSSKMSKDLKNTADLAVNIELGNETEINFSNVNEIKTIQRSLLSLNSKLKLKQKSRKKLLDEMVHQTRTPLTILKTHLEGFEDGIINMTPEEIKICENQIDNITLIIKNMSSMIDAEKDNDSVYIEEFELNQLLNQIIVGLKAQFDKKNIELNILNHKKLNIKTDKYKLSQSIYNILTNAYKFTETGGKVLVNYEVEHDGLIISIEDNGIGISEVDKKHLFEVYYRGSSAAKSTGDGIGLYVVKENLNKINGTVNVISEVGKGSKFIIKISKY
jgi:signal transduction histidine kinase